MRRGTEAGGAQAGTYTFVGGGRAVKLRTRPPSGRQKTN
jgi:hypothetical protein